MRARAHRHRGLRYGGVVAAALFCASLAATARAGSVSPHQSFLGGPWELVFKMGLEGAGYRFRIKVPSEDKPYTFDSVLPIMGTPIKIRINEYLPDLQFEEYAVDDPNGGALAKVHLTGPRLDQTLWLNVNDPAKQSISAAVGAVALKRLHNSKTAAEIIKTMTDTKYIGVLTVWNKDAECVELPIAKGQSLSLPGSSVTVEILEYYPHYSVNSETKDVTNRSNLPINPAIKIRLTDGAEVSESWLWSKIPYTPHKTGSTPLDLQFTDFHRDPEKKGQYIVAMAAGSPAWLLSSGEGKITIGKAETDKAYPFGVEGFSFTIQAIHDKAVIRSKWENRSNTLMHPALIATVDYDNKSEQVILPLNKPNHLKTESGTVVLFFRRNPELDKAD